MNKLTLTVCSLCLFLLWPGHAMAQESRCVEAADNKRLSGAARNSFLTKCQRDSKDVCEAAAAEKKLNGAARTSFLRKCEREAAGQAG